MRVGRNNHKLRRYTFPLPLMIKSDAPILITDGKGRLVHNGNIVITKADIVSVEFEPQETKETTPDISVILGRKSVREPSLPEGYTLLTTSEAKSASYGRGKSTYEYYKRERDMSFIAVVRRNGDSKLINLGSLFDPNTTISIALNELSREKPFYRRDLKAERMPSGLKHGQILKACLDVLVEEGFLDRTEVPIGKKRRTDRYIRTAKQLP